MGGLKGVPLVLNHCSAEGGLQHHVDGGGPVKWSGFTDKKHEGGVHAGRPEAPRGISPLWVALLMVVVAGVVVLTLASGIYQVLGGVQSAGEQPGLVRVEAVRAGIGFIDIYATSIGARARVDTLYLYDCTTEEWKLFKVLPLASPVQLEPGKTVLLHVPLIGSGLDPSRLPSATCIALGTHEGTVARSREKVNMAPYLALAERKATITLLAGRGVSCTVGDRRIDPNQVHWVEVNLVTGVYRFTYISGSDVRTTSGRATILRGTSTLDLSSMSWDERYQLGPIVIFVNPYYATRDYTVSITDIYSHTRTYTLRKLADRVEDVSMDILVAWEDLWWPGTGASLDNYVDHVLRLTVFSNNTARIEVLHASGCYLHMFALNPVADGQTLARQYMENEYRLPESSGIVYVKTHGAEVPPLDPNDLWDPVNGVWATTWPPVFMR